jgi:hypothetical protein
MVVPLLELKSELPRIAIKICGATSDLFQGRGLPPMLLARTNVGQLIEGLDISMRDGVSEQPRMLLARQQSM